MSFIDKDRTIQVTKAEIDQLILDSELIPTYIYNITDASLADNGDTANIFIEAVTNNELATSGKRLMHCIKNEYYTPFVVSDLFTNHFTGIYGQGIAAGSYPNSGTTIFSNQYFAIWGGRMWKRNTTGADNNPLSNYDLDSTGWTIIPYTGDSNSYVYQERIFDITYDYENDWIISISDWKDNMIITTIIDSNNLLDIVKFRDFGRHTDWGNKSIYNNKLNKVRFVWVSNPNPINIGIYNNSNGGSIYNNINGGSIYNNINGGSIYNNSNGGSIYNNSNGGSIYNNSNSGHIYNNSNSGRIISNSNSGHIYNNSNNGWIDNNSNNGSIFDNSNNGWIIMNINAGWIINNSNNGWIERNSNNGQIDSNSNNGQIINNSNNGWLDNNSNNGWIEGNSNNGWIQNNSNNGTIKVNSNLGSIRENNGLNTSANIQYNQNVGNIEANGNTVIQYNQNNGEIRGNFANIFSVLVITTNKNNGNITNNKNNNTTGSISIRWNINNGIIGHNAVIINRTINVQDTQVNK